VVEQGTEGLLPLSALRPVHRAITGVNTAVGLDATLKAIADGVAGCTPFRNVAVNVVREDGDLHCSAIAGPPELSEALLGNVCARRAAEKLLDNAEPWGSHWLLRDTPLGSVPGGISFPGGWRQKEETEEETQETQEAEGDVKPDDTEPDDTGPDDTKPDGTKPDSESWLDGYSLMAPMRDGAGELVGIVWLGDPEDGLIPPAWVGAVLEMFTEQAAIAIFNARRHDESESRLARLEQEREELRSDIAERHRREEHLRHQARHDALTGLANPVELNERLVAMLADQIPIAVVFCDLDRFKEVNDSRGHAVGDSVLRVVAERLRGAVRGEDVVARVGGDEFVVVAAGIGSDEAKVLMDRIDQAFAHPMPITGDRLLVGVSLGLAYEPARPENALAPEERAQELLGSADREMYARKRARASFTRLLMPAWGRRATAPG
jgi:diguanylate cyclase (GGDEF)-like protein